MNIQIVHVSGTLQTWQKDAVDVYAKRIQKMRKINVHRIPSRHSKGSAEEQKKAEARSFLQHTPKQTKIVQLDALGKSMTSEAWANQWKTWEDQGCGTLTYWIGGSYGFDKTLDEAVDLKINLGLQTMSHQLVLVVLFEQIYRSLTILHGHPYHHA